MLGMALLLGRATFVLFQADFFWTVVLFVSLVSSHAARRDRVCTKSSQALGLCWASSFSASSSSVQEESSVEEESSDRSAVLL